MPPLSTPHLSQPPFIIIYFLPPLPKFPTSSNYSFHPFPQTKKEEEEEKKQCFYLNVSMELYKVSKSLLTAELYCPTAGIYILTELLFISFSSSGPPKYPRKEFQSQWAYVKISVHYIVIDDIILDSHNTFAL